MKHIIEKDGQYYRNNGEKIYQITNFVIKPMRMELYEFKMVLQHILYRKPVQYTYIIFIQMRLLMSMSLKSYCINIL